MNSDHDAIRRAYPTEVKKIIDDVGIFDWDKKPFTVDESKVAAARAELDALKYKKRRRQEYPDWGTQLDYIYHNGIDKWKTDIVDPVKAKYPKPS